MAKLFSPQVGQNFGEAFLSEFNKRRTLRQQQEQFNQQMAFRNRQLNFLDIYRRGLLEDREKTLALNIQKEATDVGQFDETLGFQRQKELTDIEQEKEKIRVRERGQDLSFQANLDRIAQQQLKLENKNIPKPEKWKNFGTSISEFKTLDKSDNDYENKRTAARQSAYATMLPNAYSFYKKYFIDQGSENRSNKWFLGRVRWGLQNDLINDEDAQDLIDFSAYRSDLFDIGLRTKPDETNFLGF